MNSKLTILVVVVALFCCGSTFSKSTSFEELTWNHATHISSTKNIVKNISCAVTSSMKGDTRSDLQNVTTQS